MPASERSRHALVIVAIVVVTAAILYAMGRTPICECGTIKLWHGDAWSAESSQHISDWYTPSHVIHGFVFYGLLVLVARRVDWLRPLGRRAVGAVLIEAGWEILENSPVIINRYREATAALGYSGDSIINSVADICWMLLGFFIAWRLPWWGTVALAVLLELAALIVIRDNLTLNVLMLVFPVEAIKTWQMGAH